VTGDASGLRRALRGLRSRPSAVLRGRSRAAG